MAFINAILDGPLLVEVNKVNFGIWQDAIAKAHEKFCAGFLGIMAENPLGIKEYYGMYGDYMRLEGGAEIEMPDV